VRQEGALPATYLIGLITTSPPHFFLLLVFCFFLRAALNGFILTLFFFILDSFRRRNLNISFGVGFPYPIDPLYSCVYLPQSNFPAVP